MGRLTKIILFITFLLSVENLGLRVFGDDTNEDGPPRVLPTSQRKKFFFGIVSDMSTLDRPWFQENAMQYAFLCYHSEKEVFAWSKEQTDRVMDDLAAVENKLRSEGRLGPAARLMPTSTATTLHK